ncbi:hypothetical protein HDU96_009031 [Phlyctochytrium bullatum]|nr:hypothetical protein HDU96_009031 [Phlyctochytrium bullatum]
MIPAAARTRTMQLLLLPVVLLLLSTRSTVLGSPSFNNDDSFFSDLYDIPAAARDQYPPEIADAFASEPWDATPDSFLLTSNADGFLDELSSSDFDRSPSIIRQASFFETSPNQYGSPTKRNGDTFQIYQQGTLLSTGRFRLRLALVWTTPPPGPSAWIGIAVPDATSTGMSRASNFAVCRLDGGVTFGFDRRGPRAYTAPNLEWGADNLLAAGMTAAGGFGCEFTVDVDVQPARLLWAYNDRERGTLSQHTNMGSTEFNPVAPPPPATSTDSSTATSAPSTSAGATPTASPPTSTSRTRPVTPIDWSVYAELPFFALTGLWNPKASKTRNAELRLNYIIEPPRVSTVKNVTSGGGVAGLTNVGGRNVSQAAAPVPTATATATPTGPVALRMAMVMDFRRGVNRSDTEVKPGYAAIGFGGNTMDSVRSFVACHLEGPMLDEWKQTNTTNPVHVKLARGPSKHVRPDFLPIQGRTSELEVLATGLNTTHYWCEFRLTDTSDLFFDDDLRKAVRSYGRELQANEERFWQWANREKGTHQCMGEWDDGGGGDGDHGGGFDDCGHGVAANDFADADTGDAAVAFAVPRERDLGGHGRSDGNPVDRGSCAVAVAVAHRCAADAPHNRGLPLELADTLPDPPSVASVASVARVARIAHTTPAVACFARIAAPRPGTRFPTVTPLLDLRKQSPPPSSDFRWRFFGSTGRLRRRMVAEVLSADDPRTYDGCGMRWWLVTNQTRDAREKEMFLEWCARGGEGNYPKAKGLSQIIWALHSDQSEGDIGMHEEMSYGTVNWFGILFPAMIFYAAFLRSSFNWMLVHIFFQTVGVIGLIVFASIMNKETVNWADPHPRFGVAILVIVCLQGLIGVVNRIKMNSYSFQGYFRIVKMGHRVLGYIIVVIGFIQMGLGLDALYPFRNIQLVKELIANQDGYSAGGSNAANSRIILETPWAVYFSLLVFWALAFIGGGVYTYITNRGVAKGVLARYHKLEGDEGAMSRGGPTLLGAGGYGAADPFVDLKSEAGLCQKEFTMATINEKVMGGMLFVIADGNRVYDLSQWVESHPGGRIPLIEAAGTDITQDFFLADFTADEVGVKTERGHSNNMYLPDAHALPIGPLKPLTHVPSTRSYQSSHMSDTPDPDFPADAGPLLTANDWAIVKRARRKHRHSAAAIGTLKSLHVGNVARVPRPNLPTHAHDPEEFRRYAVTELVTLAPTTARAGAIKMMRLCLLHPTPASVAEPVFEPGDAVEVQAFVAGKVVSRMYTPIRGNPLVFEIVFRVAQQESRNEPSLSEFLGKQVPGQRQIKVRGPVGKKLLPKILTPRDVPADMVFLAGGTGISPCLQLITRLLLPERQTVVCRSAYEPRAVDEIRLYPNDQIFIESHHYDGWAYGRNLTTGDEGSFPLTVTYPPCRPDFKLTVIVSALDPTDAAAGLSLLLGARRAYPFNIEIHFCLGAPEEAAVTVASPFSPVAPARPDALTMLEGVGSVHHGIVTLELMDEIVRNAWEEKKATVAPVDASMARVYVCGSQSYVNAVEKMVRRSQVLSLSYLTVLGESL